VAVVIVANVISGAVIAGFRHIGVLKSLGFTSLQVVGVYLTMVGVPTIVGCVIGTGFGALATRPLLGKIFTVRQSAVLAGGVSVRPWVNVATLLGVPAIVVLAAVIPALRAQRLSAAEAISAGSAPRTGRGLRLQRWLTGARLPRSVSLGLGLLAGRPSRTALTAATILLGVTTVTFASGLSSTMVRYGSGIERAGAVQVEVQTGSSRSPRTDAERESLLRSVPGSVHVTAEMFASVHLAGYSQSVTTTFLRGDSATLGHVLVKGRWLSGPGEVVVPPGFLNQHDLAVGDHVTLQSAGHQVRATVVGETFAGDPNSMFADWRTDSQLDLPGRASNYEVQVAHGTDIAAYIRAVHAADPGLTAAAKTTVNTGAVTLIGSASLLTVMLAVVAALGVFNTVVLNTRERRRDLGMLKSIGMTPRQVIVMMMASMATLGVIGGLLGVPIGVIAHRLIVPRMVGPAGIVLPPAMMDVWHLPTLALLAVAGVAIAVVGAAIPARSAARLAIAEVLRNE
jgi:putative ABC transport system permease protein